MKKIYKNFIDNELQFCINRLNDTLTSRLEKSIVLSYVGNSKQSDGSIKINLNCETDLSRNCGLLFIIYTITSAKILADFSLREENGQCICYCDTALKIEYSNEEFDIFEIDNYKYSNDMWHINYTQEDNINDNI